MQYRPHQDYQGATPHVPAISNIIFYPAPAHQHGNGLLGHVHFILAGCRVNGVTARRTREGKFRLSFPKTPPSNGRQHYVFSPMNDDVRQAIEAQVFEALQLVN